MSSSALPLNVSTPSKPAESDRDRTPTSSGKQPNTSTTKAGTITPSDISSPHELTAFVRTLFTIFAVFGFEFFCTKVENLLERLNSNFDEMSNQILDRSEYFGCVDMGET